VSDEPETLTPAELRVRSLLTELSTEAAPRGMELTRDVVRIARWQRPARRLLVAVGSAVAAVAGGAGSAFRAYRRR
jgi:hypothetical protein